MLEIHGDKFEEMVGWTSNIIPLCGKFQWEFLSMAKIMESALDDGSLFFSHGAHKIINFLSRGVVEFTIACEAVFGECRIKGHCLEAIDSPYILIIPQQPPSHPSSPIRIFQLLDLCGLNKITELYLRK